MEKEKIFEEYKKIADFIADINGENCEVLILDIEDIEHSIIYLRNGHITNRKLGGGITDYALSIIMNSEHQENDFVTNYIGRGPDGKIIRSSTYFIKENQKLIGLLCINYDITELLNFKKEMDRLIIIEEEKKDDNPVEDFNVSMEKTIQDIIAKGIMEADKDVPLNHIEDEKNPIRIMYRLGLFKVKGAVDRVAKLFDVSVQSVYRYVKELDNEFKYGGNNGY